MKLFPDIIRLEKSLLQLGEEISLLRKDFDNWKQMNAINYFEYSTPQNDYFSQEPHTLPNLSGTINSDLTTDVDNTTNMHAINSADSTHFLPNQMNPKV